MTTMRVGMISWHDGKSPPERVWECEKHPTIERTSQPVECPMCVIERENQENMRILFPKEHERLVTLSDA